MELRSSLVVESPIPPDATIWDQALVYVVRRGWEQARPSPVPQQVSHTWLFPAQRETWVTAGSHVEETWWGLQASYAFSSSAVRSPPPTPTLWVYCSALLPQSNGGVMLDGQVSRVPCSDTGTCPALGSALLRGLLHCPTNPAEQLWGVRGKDEEINCVINLCRIKLNYL